MSSCEKCGSKVFFVEAVSTYVEVDGELIIELDGKDLRSRNCVKCTYPELFGMYEYLDQKE